MSHRKSILEEYIDNRQNPTRLGFNCYIDSALITCRSLCGLLGFEVVSHNVTDMGDASQPKVKFDKFKVIRKNLDAGIIINNIKTKEELMRVADWEKIIICLNAANKCVAHFDEDLEHEATPEIVAIAAKAVLREVESRIKV